jgi:hypothetical protein
MRSIISYGMGVLVSEFGGHIKYLRKVDEDRKKLEADNIINHIMQLEQKHHITKCTYTVQTQL